METKNKTKKDMSNDTIHSVISRLSELRDKYLSELEEISVTDEKKLKLMYQNMKSYQEIITLHFFEYVSGRLK